MQKSDSCNNYTKTTKHLYTRQIMRYIILGLLLVFAHYAVSQNYNISGVITEENTLEPVVGVAIGVKNNSNIGEISDVKGMYSINLPAGDYTLLYKIVGYKPLEKKITVKGNLTVDVTLEPDLVLLDEIEVSALKKDRNIKNVESGVDRLEVATISKIPVLLGEKDILKTLQLLPGVQSAGEGNTGFYVRGGSEDQNLILLDNATVYNPSHLFGFFSTFNSDAVEDITIYKGSMPANYGGRLSSTLDVSMRDGDMKKYGITGGIGLISSRLTVEGPIKTDKASFIVSARRTYADALARAAGVKQVKKSSLYFYDLNAKISYHLSKKDKLTLTAYHGRDKLGLDDLMNTDWGNTIAGVKWNHIFSDKASSTTSFSYTNYSYNVGIEMTSDIDIASHIRDYNLSQEFTLLPSERSTVKLGVTSVYRQIVPGEITARDTTKYSVDPYTHRYSWDNAIYASHNLKLTDELEVNYGLRGSVFSVLGGGNYYKFNNNQQVTDTIHTKRGEFVKNYFNLEPRISVAYQLNDFSSIKTAYTRTTQNLHMLSTSPMSNTFDRWTGSTNYIKPEIADQISFGYFRNFANNMFEFSAEVYYKGLKNQIDYKDAADILGDDNFETEILFGKGRAYGLELFLKKKHGRLNGWIGYTLSRSEKKIDKINDNKWYAANQDRTHDLSVVAIYELNKRWTISGTWVYASGNPMTFPSGKYMVDGHTIQYYEGRNQYKAEPFHRLDLGATFVMVDNAKRYSELSFGLYNAYGRQNVYMYDFRQSQKNPSVSEMYKIYLFSVIPSISWNFRY